MDINSDILIITNNSHKFHLLNKLYEEISKLPNLPPHILDLINTISGLPEGQGKLLSIIELKLIFIYRGKFISIRKYSFYLSVT